MAKKNTPKVPGTPGACADKLFELRAQKAAAQKVVDDIGAEVALIEEHLINTLPADDAEGVIGKLATAKIVSKTIPTVEADKWPEVYEYVRKNKAFDLLQRRLNAAAVKARWEEGEAIPGVGKFIKKDISLTKR